MFQSAPLTEARGDTAQLFQSAPLTEARGDTVGQPSKWFCTDKGFCGFNPLPSPKQGETIRSPHPRGGASTGNPLDQIQAAAASFQSAPLTEARGDIDVSIRSPHRSKGRHPAERLAGVSIRSPHRSKGRQRNGQTIHEFQSAPLTEARGDRVATTCPSTEQSFNPLPSPKQGETRLLAGGRALLGIVSIRSPHRSKGRPQPPRLPDQA